MNASMTRRRLLRGSAVLAASAAATRGTSFAFAPQASSDTIRLGIASYTFRKFDRQHLIDFMHQLKTPYLNLKDVHLPMTPLDQVKQIADQYRADGFILTAAGNITFNKDDDADIRQKFEYVKTAGIPIMVCAPTRQVLPRMEKFVKEYNIKMAIHNHGPEDKNFPSPFDVLDAVKNMDERVGLCIDVGHATRAGADVPKAIHAAGRRLHDLHVKDLADGKVKESQVAVGDGVLPFPQIFRALQEINYPGCVDLEYEINADDPMPGVIKSFAYMRGVIAGMGLKSA